MRIEEFETYLHYERNCSDRTYLAYTKALMAFKAYFDEHTESQSETDDVWGKVDTDLVRNWVMKEMERGISARTINRELSSLRTFYKFLLMRGWVKKDPVHNLRGPKMEKKLPSFVREQDMNSLLDGPYFTDDFDGARDHLILQVFYCTGIRVSELVGLDCNDVDLLQQQLKVTGKRNKQRIVPFGEELKEEFQAYLHLRDALAPPEGKGEKGNALFLISTSGRRISKEKTESIVKKYLALVTTVQRKSPHTLRHTFATTMLNHHADLQSVKELLGHESLATTEIYTHTTLEELKQMYNQAHPRAPKSNDYGD